MTKEKVKKCLVEETPDQKYWILDEEVKKFVASDEGAIAFIDALNLCDPLRCHL